MTAEVRLRAGDALTHNLATVSSEEHPPKRAMPPDQQFAVVDREQDRFLGLVGLTDIASRPHRIFADLVVSEKQLVVADDTPIEALPGMFNDTISALAVLDAQDQIIGAITHDSLMRRLLSWHVEVRNDLVSARRESERLTLEIRELAHHQLTHIEELRRAMSRELHDEIAQNCAALKWHAEIIKDCCEPAPTMPIRERADSIIAISGTMQDGLRRLLKGLRPELLDTTDLATAIEELLGDWRRRNPDCRITLTLDRNKCPVADPLKTHVYRIIQESLNNVSRHGGATEVEVSLGCTVDLASGAEVMVLRISDNGAGYDARDTPRGLGLIGLEERVRAIDGVLAIDTAPGTGVRIEIAIPLTDT